MPDLLNKSNIESEAYMQALEIMTSTGIIKALGLLHGEALAGRLDKSEIRALIIGAYRTVGIGAGVVFCILQIEGCSKEVISKSHWDFINESSIRNIAIEILESLNLEEGAPTFIFEHEHAELVQCGFDIYKSYQEDDNQCLNIWQKYVSTPLL